jgi:4-amino-4-deoxy-L-arabinose transferase-like glycosyltransferase
MNKYRLLRYPNWPIFFCALNVTLSVIFCFVVFSRLMDSGVALLDPDGYGRAGQVLHETGHFDSIEKAPLYPAFVALVSFLAGGYRIWAVQVAQCLLAALTCVLLYAIFRRTMGERQARWSGLACALYPMLIWYTPRLWTETFLNFVLAGFTLTLVELLQRPTEWRALLCGGMAGVVALSKGIALVFVLLTPLVLLLRFRGTAWRWLLLFGLAVIILIAPWTWRNWRLIGQFVPIHANGGYNFYLGNGFATHWLRAPLSYAKLKAYTVRDIQILYTSPGIDPPADPLAVDHILLHAALRDMRAHPLLILQKLAIQSLTFWYLAADAPKSILTGALQIPVVLAALPGVVCALRGRSWALTLLVPVVGIMGVSVVVFAFARLSVTVMPYLIGLAVYGLWPERRQVRMLQA